MEKIKSNELIQSSFFDDIKNEVEYKYELWIKGKQVDTLIPKYNYICSNKIFEGELYSRCKKTNEKKINHYVLYNDRLECFKDKDSALPYKFMFFRGVKVEKLDNSDDETIKDTYQCYCLIFCHNKKFNILYAPTAEFFKIWYKNLMDVAVLSGYNKQFKNIKVIGKGSFAKVLLAKNLESGDSFAVKTFDKKALEASSATRNRQALKNEINIMRLLNHPNIISLYEVYEGEGHIYLVEDLLKGGELFDRVVEKGFLSEREAAALITQLLKALEQMETMNIMHRDIKPENLIFREEKGMEIVLADFGLAEFSNQTEFMFKKCGTPGYVAPEVLRDANYDGRCDIFSAGCILYVMLSGCSPFFGNDYAEIVQKNKKGVVSYNFSEVNVKVSEQGQDLLKRMLEVDPDKRISIKDALNHPWILKYTDFTNQVSPTMSPRKLFNGETKRPILNIKEMMKDNKGRPSEILFNSPLIRGKINDFDSTDEIMGSPVMSKSPFSKNKSQIKGMLINPIKCEKNDSSEHIKVNEKKAANVKNKLAGMGI